MRVLYFSTAAERSGCREEEWVAEGTMSVAAFWSEAVRRHPRLAEIRAQCRIASGGEYVDAGGKIAADREAAVIPPVSGG